MIWHPTFGLPQTSRQCSNADVWLVDGGWFYNLQLPVRPAFLKNLSIATVTVPLWKTMLLDLGDQLHAQKYRNIFDIWNQAKICIAVHSLPVQK
jgi:hypothetical protein